MAAKRNPKGATTLAGGPGSPLLLVLLLLVTFPRASFCKDEEYPEYGAGDYRDYDFVEDDVDRSGLNLRRSASRYGSGGNHVDDHFLHSHSHRNKHHHHDRLGGESLDPPLRGPIVPIDPHLASYSFRYRVDGPPVENHSRYNNAVLGSSGVPTKFGHEERRQGGRTRGSYFVALPDGRTQTVEYTVEGDTGYRAKVSYDGEAHYLANKLHRGQHRPHPVAAASSAHRDFIFEDEDVGGGGGGGRDYFPSSRTKSSRKLDQISRHRGHHRHRYTERKLKKNRRLKKPPPALQFETRPLERKPFRRFTIIKQEKKGSKTINHVVPFVPTPPPRPSPAPSPPPPPPPPPPPTDPPIFPEAVPAPSAYVAPPPQNLRDLPLPARDNKIDLLPKPTPVPPPEPPPLRTLENFRSGLLLSENGLLLRRRVGEASSSSSSSSPTGDRRRRRKARKVARAKQAERRARTRVLRRRRLIVKRPKWKRWKEMASERRKKRKRRKKIREKAEEKEEDDEESARGGESQQPAPAPPRAWEEKLRPETAEIIPRKRSGEDGEKSGGGGGGGGGGGNGQSGEGRDIRPVYNGAEGEDDRGGDGIGEKEPKEESDEGKRRTGRDLQVVYKATEGYSKVQRWGQGG